MAGEGMLDDVEALSCCKHCEHLTPSGVGYLIPLSLIDAGLKIVLGDLSLPPADQREERRNVEG